MLNGQYVGSVFEGLVFSVILFLQGENADLLHGFECAKAGLNLVFARCCFRFFVIKLTFT